MTLLSLSTQHSLETFTYRHRLTFANIVSQVIIGKTQLSGALAIVNDNAKRTGKIQFGGIGGGARISAKGRELLLADTATQRASAMKYDDLEFGEDVDGDVDARMTVLATNEDELAMRKHFLFGAVLRFAAWKANDLLETTLDRELREELVDDLPSILTERQLAELKSELIGYHVGPDRQSTRGGGGGLMTTPVALCHRLTFPTLDAFCALLNDPLRRVRHLSSDEVATTKGGTTEGRTRDGHPIFTNVFDPFVIMNLPTLS